MKLHEISNQQINEGFKKKLAVGALAAALAHSYSPEVIQTAQAVYPDVVAQAEQYVDKAKSYMPQERGLSPTQSENLNNCLIGLPYTEGGHARRFCGKYAAYHYKVLSPEVWKYIYAELFG